MRIVRITDKSPVINSDGDWLLFCMVQRGNSFVYGAIVCSTMQEAFELKEGQLLDAERVRFDSRIKVVNK